MFLHNLYGNIWLKMFLNTVLLWVVPTSCYHFSATKKKKEQKRRERGFQTAESEGKGKNRSKRLAGYVREHECRAVPVVGKGENILLSLCVSCGRWDGEQLMAFHVITYLRLPLHSYLDPSLTEPFFSLSWNTHTILSHQPWSLSAPFSSALSLNFSITFFQVCIILFMNRIELSIWVNLRHSPWQNTDKKGLGLQIIV